MANFDIQEMKMFSKWYSASNLVNNSDFWRDCFSAYLSKTVTLPVYDEPHEHATVLGMIKCPPGECGWCCHHYEKIAITQVEYEGLVALNRGEVHVIHDEYDNLFLNLMGGCQFLSNNLCTIYAWRPGVCRSFPIITPQVAITPQGKQCKQMRLQLECRAAFDAIRIIFTSACSSGKTMLLPDLSLVPVYDNGKGVLGSINTRAPAVATAQFQLVEMLTSDHNRALQADEDVKPSIVAHGGHAS